MNFPLNVVLSATTGRLLCPIDQVYKILNQVTGDNLFTHVLPRASKFASPLIKQQYPELAKADAALPDLVHLFGSAQRDTACANLARAFEAGRFGGELRYCEPCGCLDIDGSDPRGPANDG